MYMYMHMYDFISTWMYIVHCVYVHMQLESLHQVSGDTLLASLDDPLLAPPPGNPHRLRQK